MDYAKKWNRFGGLLKGCLRANEWPIALAFAVVCMGILGWAASVHRYPVTLEHNVAVYGKLPDGDWSMSSDEEGHFAYRPCPEFRQETENILEQGIGYVAPRALWEERGECKSIAPTGLGFYWRDDNNEYRRIANARPPR